MLLSRDCDLYHYLAAQRIVGRWSHVFRPSVENDDPIWYLVTAQISVRNVLESSRNPAVTQLSLGFETAGTIAATLPPVRH